MQAVLLSLLALAPAAAFAQNFTFFAGLITALQNANLTHTIAVASSLNTTLVGQSILAELTNGGPHVLFAPTDEAWTTAPSNVTSNDPSVLANVFAYHVVPGNFTGVTTRYPNTTVGETLYNDTATVHLEGGRPQALAWAVRSDNLTHVLNQRNDTAIVNVTTFENFTIYIIDHVLDLPQSLEITIPTDNDSLSEFENYLNDASLAFFNTTTNQTSDVTFFEALNTGYKGFTLFAPNNSAIIAANSTLQSLLSNRSAINAILFNHFINATTLYSPLLTGSQNFTSQGGETFSFSINSTGQYVTQGNVTALIIQPDVILPNGVIHIIDSVIINTDSDSSAAASALSSAVSAASTAAAATQTVPVGFSITQSLAGSSSASGSSASNTAGSNAGMSVFALSKQTILGAAMAVLSIVAGSVLTLV